MNDEQQWNEFLNRLKVVAPEYKLNYALSSANLPRVLSNAFRFGVFNLNNLNTIDKLLSESKPLALATRLSLPPINFLNLALVFQGEQLQAFRNRLAEIKAAIEESRPDDQSGGKGKGSSGANNVRVYVHDGGIYLWQHEGEPDEVRGDEAEFGAKLSPSGVYFADVAVGAALRPVEVEYVGHISRLLGAIPFQRLDATGSTSGQSAINLASFPIEALKSRISSLGARLTDEQIERYHVAQTHLRRKHFVILTGISGTGKTLLARAYAYSVCGVSSLDLDCPAFFLVPVRPEWTEPAHLLGYLDALSGTYKRTAFIEALLHAHQNPHRPVFVCLDEMNIAQPEYYFADVLSAMETGEAIRLHDGSDDVVPQSIAWPNNLHITGTVNVDETTRGISPKVLDRANVIDMSAVDIRAFCEDLKQRGEELETVLTESVIDLFEQLSEVLTPHGLHFGYRTIEEITRYMKRALDSGVLADKSLDAQIEQKVLTKLRGGLEMTPVLDRLHELVSSMDMSKATIERLQRDLENLQSFEYWA